VRIYVEALEVPPETVLPEYIPEFLRLDATNKDFSTILSNLKAMLHPNKKYSLRKHYCYHEEGRSCDIRILEDK